MKYCLLLISFLFYQCLYSQANNKDLSITISAKTSVTGGEYLVHIYRQHEHIKIVYLMRDSIDYLSLQKDKNYKEYWDTLLRLFNNLKENKNRFNFYFERVDSIIKQFTYYKRDSILVKAKSNVSYSNLLDEILHTPTEVPENRAANKNRFVMDGTHFKFDIQSKESRSIHVHSPRPNSHPLLYQFISETLGMYRRSATNTFLDKKYTSGY
jgi:hypothetical protein